MILQIKKIFIIAFCFAVLTLSNLIFAGTLILSKTSALDIVGVTKADIRKALHQSSHEAAIAFLKGQNTLQLTQIDSSDSKLYRKITKDIANEKQIKYRHGLYIEIPWQNEASCIVSLPKIKKAGVTVPVISVCYLSGDNAIISLSNYGFCECHSKNNCDVKIKALPGLGKENRRNSMKRLLKTISPGSSTPFIPRDSSPLIKLYQSYQAKTPENSNYNRKRRDSRFSGINDEAWAEIKKMPNRVAQFRPKFKYRVKKFCTKMADVFCFSVI